MIEIINLFIPNFVTKYRKKLGWRRIENILSKKYQRSPQAYNQIIEQIITETYTPEVYLPKTLTEFFNMFVTMGKLIEIIHAIILFPLLLNLRALTESRFGIFSKIAHDLVNWSSSSLIFAFNGSSFDNICT